MLEGDIAEALFQGVLGEARAGQLLSDEHFTVDGTLLEAWASHKSFRPVDPVGKDNDQEPKPPAARWDENNPTVNYRGEKRTNQTHCSTTDPQAMLARKGPGKEAKLSYHGHLMTENRSGLVVNTQVTTAYGSAECHAGLLMAEQLPGCGRVTLGADKGYDQREFVEELRCMGVTPHVAQNQGRRRSRFWSASRRCAGCGPLGGNYSSRHEAREFVSHQAWASQNFGFWIGKSGEPADSATGAGRRIVRYCGSE